jgi:hypothetical protein
MAAFALLGLSIALGVVALIGLRPWATTSVVPNLSVSPGTGVALGDATVVARASSPSAGTGGIAAPRPAGTVSAPVAVATPAPAPRATRPVLAVSPGRPLTFSATAPVASPPAPEPAAAAPAPVAVTPMPAAEQAPPQPVVATTGNPGSGSPGGPVSSGVDGPEPEPACEGDEYLITVSFDEGTVGEEADYELAEADILVQRFGADGSETDAQLRGDLSDVRSLIATLVAEGNCVGLEIGTAAGGGVPSGGTSQVVVPPEGTPPPVPNLVAGDQAAPNSP